MSDRAVVIVSNRGPLSFTARADRSTVATKTGGGLASAMAPLLGEGAHWICCAMSDADRAAMAEGLLPDTVHMVDHGRETFEEAYDRIANEVLWFAHHGLLREPPARGTSWQRHWASFVTYNETMADHAARVAPHGAAVLIQDYHLCLVAPGLRERRPDLRLVHFSHTPFAAPGELELPDGAREEILRGMAAHHACGFHSSRWADTLVATSQANGIDPAPTFVSPLAPDTTNVRRIAGSAECAAQLRLLQDRVGGRRLLTRVDRIEPSKNILAGFDAYDRLLRMHPEWCDRVVFAAYTYPSRESVEIYRRLREDIVERAGRVNDDHGTADWTPVVLDVTDNLEGAVAAMSLYDVLLVNPLRDGLNLVAMEGPIVNSHSGRVVLSNAAGAHDQLRDHVFGVEPSDIDATAEAIHTALCEGPAEAAARADHLRALIEQRTPTSWLNDQLRAAETS